MVVLQHWLEIIIDYRLESVGSSDVILLVIIGSAFSASVWMFHCLPCFICIIFYKIA